MFGIGSKRLGINNTMVQFKKNDVFGFCTVLFYIQVVFK